MTEAVLDASVVLKWFHTEGEQNVEAARALRTEFEVGRLVAFAPPLLFLEIINVAGRRWHLSDGELRQLATTLPRLGLGTVEPELELVAGWVSKGLTAYDAVYVSVAEQTGAQLITDDREILAVAPSLTRSLAQDLPPHPT